MNERRCIVTRQSRPPGELIRFVAGPDGVVVPDLRARLPGRGAWVTAQRQTVESAVRSNAFSRALKQDVAVARDLAEMVEHLLRERTLAALGLAARAGSVVTGFTKVDRAARRGDLAVVLTASDGAADGRRKIAAAVSAAPRARPTHVSGFSAAELGLALGRPNVVHAGVVAGRVAASLETALTRYETYRPGGPTSVRAA
jgi:hypothetical protein